MLGGGRQLPERLGPGVETPANAGVPRPATNPGQIGLVQPEPPPHRRQFQQAQHLAGVEPPAPQLQQREQPFDQRLLGQRPPVGNAERNPSLARRAGEHRLDQRSVTGDVGRHHNHVGRPQRRVRREQRQQLIVHHLNLAHRPVAGVNLERTIIRPQRQRRMVITAPLPQMQDVGL